MASRALPAWTHPRHPVVRGETRHWQRSRVWRAVRYVVWGGSLLFLAGPVACTLLVSLLVPFNSAAEAVLVAGGTFTFGLAVVSAMAGALTGLLAGLLGATLIARERECQSWTFLRLTTLSSLEIVGGKFIALLYSLAYPLHFVVGLRGLTLLCGALTVVLAVAVSGLSWADLAQLVGLGTTIPMSGFNWLALQLSLLLGVPVGVAAWLFEPYFSAVYNGAVGLAASALARSRGAGIVLTVATHFVLGLGLYGPAQQVLTFGMVGLLRYSDALIGLLPFLTIVVPIILYSALQGVVLVACLLFALFRAEHLSE